MKTEQKTSFSVVVTSDRWGAATNRCPYIVFGDPERTGFTTPFLSVAIITGMGPSKDTRSFKTSRGAHLFAEKLLKVVNDPALHAYVVSREGLHQFPYEGPCVEAKKP